LAKLVIPNIITEEELLKVLQNTKQNHHKLAFALGFYECMRVSEVVKLKQDDVDKTLKLLWIKQAKGSKDRKIPIAPEIMNGLKHIPVKCGVRALEMAFKKQCRVVLNKDCHFHTL
jgi:integrase